MSISKLSNDDRFTKLETPADRGHPPYTNRVERITSHPAKASTSRARALPDLSESITISVTIPRRTAPAFRAAVEELSMRLGERIKSPGLYANEQSLTNAITAVGAFRAQVNAVVEREDPFYPNGGAK